MAKITIDTDDVVTLAEAARRLGMTRQAVSNWIVRYATFPRPLIDRPFVKLWSWEAISAWLEEVNS